jgi:Cu(I)/Ag(I) efflux system membrane protein CusA/SilA
MFGMSFVYVVFEEGTDIYWARSRVLEYLGTRCETVPAGRHTAHRPDATGIGWVYQYALVDRLGTPRPRPAPRAPGLLAPLRPHERPGVSEVASVGGFEQQYQVTVDPVRLRNFGLTIADVARRDPRSNATWAAGRRDVAARVLRPGRGYVGPGARTSRRWSSASGEGGTPVLRARRGQRAHGRRDPPRRRRLDGQGEAVSGIVVMRYGENALDVIERVEAQARRARPSLPPGVEVVPVYSRAGLIERAIDTLRHALTRR